MKYLKLLRIKHYIKNILIFVPLMFAGALFSQDKLMQVIIGFVMFSLVSSIVYILNDVRDIDKDRQHPTKRFRPLASGDIKKEQAIMIAFLLAIIVICINFFAVHNKIWPLTILGVYLILNVFYSFGLKNYPIIDVVILASGYVLRIYFGALLVDIAISNWLYLSVMALSFFLGFGKRRNELIKRGVTYRKVLQHYTKEFLDKVMYMFLAITIVFYSLWCENAVDIYGIKILFSIPIVILVVLKYTLIIEKDSDGDPVEVILADKGIVILGVLYSALMLYILYSR